MNFRPLRDLTLPVTVSDSATAAQPLTESPAGQVPTRRFLRLGARDWLAVIVCSLMAFGVVQQSQNQIQQALELDLQSDADHTASRIESLSNNGTVMGGAQLMGLVASSVKRTLSTRGSAGNAETLANFKAMILEFNARSVAVIDADGTTRAVLDQTGRTEGVGVNYSVRPYFGLAMAGRPNIFPAVETQTNERDLFYAAPVRNPTDPPGVNQGVLIVEMSAEILDAALDEHSGPALLVSPDGVVFAANRESWTLRLVAPVPAERQGAINSLYQFGSLFTGKGPSLIPVHIKGKDAWDASRHYAVARHTLNWPDQSGQWQVLLLTDRARPTTERIQQGLRGAAFWLIGLFAYFAWSRRNRMKEAAAAQREANEAELRRISAMAEASTQRMRDMSDALPCAVFQLIKPAQGKLYCAFVGKPVVTLLGVTVAEILKDHQVHLRNVHPEDLPPLIQTLQGTRNLVQEGLTDQVPVSAKYRVVLPKGIRWIQMHAFGAKRGDTMVWSGYWMDVTEQTEAMATVAEQLRFQELLIDAIPTPIFIKDTQARYLSVNQAYEDAYGVKREELIGKDLTQTNQVARDLREQFQREQLELIATGGMLHKERDILWKDGTLHHELYWGRGFRRPDGSPAGMVGVSLDITRTMEVQRTMERREQMMRTVLETAPSALVVSRTDGSIVFYNQRALDIFQISAEQLKAEGSIARYADPAERRSLRGKLEERSSFGAEVERKRGDGTHFWSYVTATKGEFDGSPAVFSWTDDISQRKQTADALQQAKEAAEAAASAKSAFLANMSHEIRTPMNAIIGLAHLALRTDLSTQQRDYIQKVHGAGQSLLGIINDILDFSKIEAGKLEVESIAMNLDDVLTQVSTVTSGKAWEKGLELLFEVPGNVPRQLLSDPLRLGQVLVNLINNAVKFTETGQILVRCHATGMDPSLALTEQTSPDKPTQVRLHFSIQDTGIGMTPEQCSRLFTAFSQADESTTRKFGGTGLGLSISKRLVELLDGEITVQSEAGKGSDFRFTWVCTLATGEQTPRRHLPDNLSGMRVLVVDDNMAARDILGSALREFKMQVDMASGGTEALAAIRSGDADQPYRVIFTDWNMPGMDGIALTEKIKADPRLLHQPQVVLVTAFGREEIRQRAEQTPVDGFMLKPINQSMLVDTLVRLFATDIQRESQTYQQTEQVPRLDGLRVLLAEDNEINQQIAVELMHSAGVNVDVADNGQIAVDKLLKGGPQAYHLVLMDLQMPIMDGHQATLAIRKDPQFAQLPIIAMTAHALVEERARCIAEGMNDHITKPIDPALLYQTLQHWGGHAAVPVVVSAASPARPASMHASPTTNGAAEVDALQAAVPGLDVASALRRVAGNLKLYQGLLRRYADDQAHAPERIRDRLALGDRSGAELLAHTLKGVSSNIGAQAVAAQAALLETALRGAASPEALADLLTQTTQALVPLVAELQAWLSPGGDAAEGSASLQPIDLDLQTELHALGRMLDDMDGDASELLEALLPRLQSCIDPQVLRDLHTKVSDFNFDDAAALLREVLA